jgi:3-phenylpropionate/trans-cinnamate dioxygenase ferredoxin reductase subunit
MSPLQSSDHVIVVGAGLAGWRFVEALRREGYDGALTLIGEEPYAPYDRPPLSKHVLAGKWDVERTLLATPELVEEHQVTLHLGVTVTDLDVAATTVRLRDDSSLSGTHVVIATGAKARLLPYSASDQIHTVRSRDDVLRLNRDLASLQATSPIAIVGGGFIGAEAATSLRARGFSPIVLEAALRPLVNVLGPNVSAWLADLAGAAGIELRNEQQIADVVATDQGLVVLFADGSTLEAGAVIVGAGAVTNDEWLKTSGLTIDNGVVVDENLLATERVGAIGDVARFSWKSTSGTELVRIEHWQVANDHAAHLAHYWMTGESPSALMVPYFWSDQYGKKIQMLGHARPNDTVTRVSGSIDEGKWVALFSRGGTVTGVVALSKPRGLMLSKSLLEEPTSLDEALARAPWAS